MEKLRIDKPCQENWNEFTPKPEGGFCGSCTKIVIDFTNKTNDQIKTILETKQNESVCGRIGVTQLANYNMTLAEWQANQNPEIVQSRFLWALLLAFGFSLFSACNTNAQTTMGKMMSSNELVEDSIKINQPKIIAAPELDSLYYEEMIMGDIAPYEEIVDTTVSDTINTTQKKIDCKKPIPPKPILQLNHPIVMGLMIAPPPAVEELEDSSKSAERIEKLTVPTEILKPDDPIIMGTMINPELEKNAKINESEKPVLNESAKKSDNNYEAVVGSISPNPTSSEANLQLAILRQDHYTVNLLDSRGSLLQVITSKNLAQGNYNYRINMGTFTAGQYYISITSKGHQSTIKLIKN